MTSYTPKQSRHIGEAALAGDVLPRSEVESDDLKASRAAIEQLQRQAQERINAGRTPGIGAAP
jgi:hypothetical protein